MNETEKSNKPGETGESNKLNKNTSGTAFSQIFNNLAFGIAMGTATDIKSIHLWNTI
ncbi:hypothetical protein [Thermoactinomyces mirandus]|uniref:Uncharacterized protein n=1 Tax=Thermoactinomyces mirandus TaxID=2756294 RepID=A0A7W1XTT1_9BACL|nr:hypothetical protein [Thermoactinomyces mirandus]MBA4603091.1 hypothetical protein [Thermoactinomyces mirandus]